MLREVIYGSSVTPSMPSRKVIASLNLAAAIALFFFISNRSYSATVRHLLQSFDTPYSVMTQGACYDLHTTKTRMICVPAGFLFEKKPSIKLNGLLKIDEKSYEFADRVISNRFDKAFLEKLFAEDSYQDASATIGLQAVFSTLSFQYIPGHLVGAYKINNPAFPELFASAMVDSQLKLTKNFVFNTPASTGYPDFFISVSPFAYDQKIFFVETTAIQVAIQSQDELIKKERYRGGDIEASVGMFPKQNYLPQISLMAFNMMSNPPCEPCGDRVRFMEIRDGTFRHFAASMAYSFPLVYGDLGLSTRFTYRERSDLDLYETPVNLIYKVSAFTAGYTISPRRYGLGFYFNNDGYAVGLQYSDEKQEDALSIERMKRTYVFLKAFI